MIVNQRSTAAPIQPIIKKWGNGGPLHLLCPPSAPRINSGGIFLGGRHAAYWGSGAGNRAAIREGGRTRPIIRAEENYLPPDQPKTTLKGKNEHETVIEGGGLYQKKNFHKTWKKKTDICRPSAG